MLTHSMSTVKGMLTRYSLQRLKPKRRIQCHRRNHRPRRPRCLHHLQSLRLRQEYQVVVPESSGAHGQHLPLVQQRGRTASGALDAGCTGPQIPKPVHCSTEPLHLLVSQPQCVHWAVQTA